MSDDGSILSFLMKQSESNKKGIVRIQQSEFVDEYSNMEMPINDGDGRHTFTNMSDKRVIDC